MKEDSKKTWTDEMIKAAMDAELIGFGSPAEDVEAFAQARGRWSLFERLRGIEGDFSAWADAPSQEAFESWARASREKWAASGEWVPRSADALPSQSVASKVDCAPVAESGQSTGAGARRGDLVFNSETPTCVAADGDSSMACEALSIGVEAAAGRVASGEWSPAELRASFEARMADADPGIHAMESLFDQGGAVGLQGPLAGLPFVAKSLFWIEGQKPTAGSKMLSRFRAPIDAPVIAGLRAAGAIPMGYARMDEFAMGGDGSRCAWGETLHPAKPGRLPGGSSSGSAAALAAGMSMFSLGSDTGGSIRIPASHCGLHGLKPTYGALSRFGMVPYAFSLDCPGAFAKTASDMAWIFEAMSSGPAGWDERQALRDHRGLGKAATLEGRRLGAMDKPWAGVRIGIPWRWVEGCDQPAKEAFASWVRTAGDMGASVLDLDWESPDEAVWAYYLLASCEAQSSLARYDPARLGWQAEARSASSWEGACRQGRSELMGREAKMRALMGAMALSEPSRGSLYAKACGLRAALCARWALAFESLDLVACPTCPGPAPWAGAPMSEELEWAQDRLAIPASLGGICALSAPWAKRSDGFDMGIQLCAPWHAEHRLLPLAIAAECCGAY